MRKNSCGRRAREFVENEIIPIIEKHSREATFPMHLVPQLGELGFFGASLHGLWLRRNVQRSVRFDDAGARTRRFRNSQLRFRAERSRDVSDLRVWQRRTKKLSGSRYCNKEKDWLLRLDRTAIRLESRRHAHSRGEKGQHLRLER